MALAAAVDIGLPELVSSACSGDREGAGVSSKALENRSGVPWGKISRLLRIICGRGFFREIRPDVWAHTRHSRALDSGLSYQQIVDHPLERYSMGAGAAAWVDTTCQIMIKVASGTPDVFRDKRRVKSYGSTNTAFNVVYNTDKSFWDWIQAVDSGIRAKNFGKAMEWTNTQAMVSLGEPTLAGIAYKICLLIRPLAARFPRLA